MEKLKKSKVSGITLISLVVTIIVLLLLAGITIMTLTGDNGILNRAGEAKHKTEEAQLEEQLKLAVSAALVDGQGSILYTDLDNELKSQFGVDNYTITPESESSYSWKVESNGKELTVYKNGAIYTKEQEDALGPGLYDASTNTLKKSWEELITEGTFIVDEEGILNRGANFNTNIIDGKLIISNEVSIISDNMFKYCVKLISIIIPETVTEIGKYGLGMCNMLEYVDIKGNISIIKERTFNYTPALKSLKIPNSIETIGKYAFSQCGVKTISIPENVTTIEEGAFYVGYLESINIPSNVKNIGRSAFANCSRLKTVMLEEGVETLEGNTFNMCLNLESISFPSTIEETGTAVCCGCSKLNKVTILGGKITQNCFTGCGNISEIYLGSKVTEVGEGAFGGNSKLKFLTIEDGEESLSIGSNGFCAWGNGILTEVTIPSRVNSIGENAFSGHSELVITLNADIEIPENKWGAREVLKP